MIHVVRNPYLKKTGYQRSHRPTTVDEILLNPTHLGNVIVSWDK